MTTTFSIDRRSDTEIFIHTSSGSGYVIKADDGWGIRIDCLGTSKIPYCPDLAERPDICEKQIEQHKDELEKMFVLAPIKPIKKRKKRVG